MPTATTTGYSMALGGQAGYINIGGWNTLITDQASSQQEVPGKRRVEGANEYVYAYNGISTTTFSGMPFKLCSSIADVDGNISPIRLTQLGATAAGYFSCVAINIKTMSANMYGWFMVRGFATLPINTDTSGQAFGTPMAPSSASAGFASCAAASAMAWACEPLGSQLATAAVLANGGTFCYLDFTRNMIGR